MDARFESNRPYAVACWLLSALFALRVLGQLIQQSLYLPFLPPAAAFQGSGIPYPLLLAAQLAILYAMLRATIRLQHGATVPRQRAGLVLAGCGGLYLAAALSRIGIGLGVADAHAWFRTWIPAAFHVVLASFVLTLAAFHLVHAREAA